MAIEERSGAELWAMAQLSTPMAVRVAATLRVADHIAAGLRTAGELAPVVRADPDALERLLSYLAVRGVFVRDAGGRFSLTRLGEALREDHPAGKRALLDIDGLGRSELSFIQLLHSVRTGQAAFPLQFGGTFWQDLAADTLRAAAFDRWMSVNVERRLPDLVEGYDWSGLGHLVDVGGGDASLLVALMTRHPGLRGTVLDLDATAMPPAGHWPPRAWPTGPRWWPAASSTRCRPAPTGTCCPGSCTTGPTSRPPRSCADARRRPASTAG